KESTKESISYFRIFVLSCFRVSVFLRGKHGSTRHVSSGRRRRVRSGAGGATHRQGGRRRDRLGRAPGRLAVGGTGRRRSSRESVAVGPYDRAGAQDQAALPAGPPARQSECALPQRTRPVRLGAAVEELARLTGTLPRG